MIKPIHKTTILVSLTVLLVAGAVGYSAYLYQHNRKPAPTVSVSQLVSERDNAVKALTIHDGVNKVDLQQANAETVSVQSKLAVVCAQVKAAHLVQALCP